MQGQNFFVQLLAKLDTSSVNTDYEKIKKKLASDPIISKLTFDSSLSKQAIKEMSTEIHNKLAQAFKESGIDSFNISVKEIQTLLSSSVKEANKLSKELNESSSNAQKFLAKFNNKTGGTLLNSKEYKEVKKAIDGLGNTHNIDQLNTAMNKLETTYNNMVAHLRSGSKSLNPFVNAITDMNNMENTIKGIGLEFEKLSVKPKAVANNIKQLNSLQSETNKYPQGTIEWAQAYGKLKTAINSVNLEISNLSKAKSANVSTQIFNISDLEKQGQIYFSKARNTIDKMMPSIEGKFKKLGFSDINVKGIEDFTGKIKSFSVTATDAEGALKKFNFEREKLQGNGKPQYGFIQSDAVQVIKTASQAQEELTAKIQKTNNALAKQQSKLAQQIQVSLDNGDFETQINKLEKQFQKYGLSIDEADNKVKELRSTLLSLNSSSGDELVSNFETWQSKLKSVKVQLEQVKLSYDKLLQPASKEEISSTLINAQKLLDNNTKATMQVRSEWEQYVLRLTTGSNITKKEIADIRTNLKQSESQMRSMGRLGLSWIDSFKQGISSFSTWVSATTIFMGFFRTLKSGIEVSKELDKALTNINYTMDVSSSQLSKIGEHAIETAKELKTSTKNVLDAVTTYANANETSESILSKSEPTIMLSNVTGMDTHSTVDILQGAMEQFDLTEDKLMHISDVFQTVSQNMPYDFADGVKQLSEGIQVSGSAASEAGYDIERYTSLLGTLISKTRQSGSELGRSVRTMMLRTTKASTSALANGEITDDDLSNAETALRRVGIEVRKDKDTFKEFDQTISELYAKIDTLSDVDLSNLAYELAGIRQANVFKMMIKSYGDYLDVAEKADNADGTTLQNQEKYIESLDGKYKGLEATVESIYTNLLKGDDIGVVIDIFQSLVNILDTVTEKLGLFETAGLAVGAVFSSRKNSLDYRFKDIVRILQGSGKSYCYG